MFVLRSIGLVMATAYVAVIVALAIAVFVIAYVQPRRAAHRARRRPFVEPGKPDPGGTGRHDADARTEVISLDAIAADDRMLDDPGRGPGRDPELERMFAAFAAACRRDEAELSQLDRWDGVR